MASALHLGLACTLLFAGANAAAGGGGRPAQKPAPSQGGCSAEKATISSLEAKVKALEAQVEQAKKECAAAGSDLPYASVEILEDTFGLLGYFFGKGYDSASIYAPEIDASKLGDVASTAQKAAMEGIDVAYKAASEATAAGTALLQEQASTALPAATKFYGQQVEPHIGEYITASNEIYKQYVEPQLKTATTMYNAQVQPHVGQATEMLSATVGTVTKEGTAGLAKLQATFGDSVGSVSAVTLGPVSGLKSVFAKVAAPQEFHFHGRTFKFPYGYLDIAAASIQAIAMLGFVFFFVWKLFLKVIFWKIIVKFFGGKVCYGTTKCTTKIGLFSTFKVIKCFWFAVRLSIRLVLSTLCLVICTLIGFGTVLSTEKGLEAGMGAGAPKLTVQLRMAAALGLGLVLWFCSCCCRGGGKKAEAKKAKKGNSANGVANGSANGTATSGTKAKSAPAKDAKKGKK